MVRWEQNSSDYFFKTAAKKRKGCIPNFGNSEKLTYWENPISQKKISSERIFAESIYKNMTRKYVVKFLLEPNSF